MTVERSADLPIGDTSFVSTGQAGLFACPDLSNPTLLFWSTARPLPSPFAIADAWDESGYFLFVSDPSQNLSNFSGISTAMKAAGNPSANSSGFAWLDMDGGNPSLLTVGVRPTGGAAGTVAADTLLGAASSSGVSQLLLKGGAPVTLQPDGQSFGFVYPAGIPQTDPPPATPIYPILLALLTGQFQFTGFTPDFQFYYQYEVVLDPLNPTNCSQTATNFAIQLVQINEGFPPAFAIAVPPQ